MKVGLVLSFDLSSRTLRARDYVDPVRDIDLEIDRTEKTISKARARLGSLREERAEILSRCAPRTKTLEIGHDTRRAFRADP